MQCSCVSALIDRSTNKHRDIFDKEHSRAEIRAEVGTPQTTWEKVTNQTPAYDTSVYGSSDAHSYDVFKVHGVVARPGDGSGQATASAVTLGTGEALMLPFTLASVVAKPFTVQHLIVFYDVNTYYQKHLIYDSKGNKINNSGY